MYVIKIGKIHVIEKFIFFVFPWPMHLELLEPWKLLLSVTLVSNHFISILCYFYIHNLYFGGLKSGVYQVSLVKILFSFKIKLLGIIVLCYVALFYAELKDCVRYISASFFCKVKGNKEIGFLFHF